MAASQQDLSGIDDVLREIWDDFQEAVYFRNALLREIPKVSGKMVGEELVFPINHQPNFGVGPRAETGGTNSIKLPSAGSQGYKQGKLKVANYYGRFKVTGRALDAAMKNGSVIDVLQREMTGLERDLKRLLNRDLFGNGSGAITACKDNTSATTVSVDSVADLRVGMPIVIAHKDTGAVVSNGAQEITAIDRANNTFDVASAVTTDTDDRVFLQGTYGSTYAEAANVSLDGLAAALGTSNSYAGINRGASAYDGWFSPITIDASNYGGLSIDLMMDMEQRLADEGSEPKLIVFHPDDWRAYANLILPNRDWPSSVKTFDGGYKGVEWNDQVITWDRDCPKGTGYFLDTDSLEFHELSPMYWMDKDGSIFHRIDDEDAYEASLVWRTQLAAKNPKHCGVISNL